MSAPEEAGKGTVVTEARVEFRREFSQGIERVWDFLIKPELLKSWYGEGSFEAREGGKLSFMGGHIRGIVTQVRAPAFLAYSWNVFNPGQTVSDYPESYLSFALEHAGQGTKLLLTHRPIPEPMQKQTMMGWHTMLDLIDHGLRGEFPDRGSFFQKNAGLYGVDMSKL